jgi:hypothetical protein
MRAEFRDRWADYYKAQKNGTEDDREKHALIISRSWTFLPRPVSV